MTTIAPLRLMSDAADLPLYPIALGVRLSSHGWFQFHHAWWRTSDFHRDADREVRAVWFDLLCAAQDEDPVGTLPVEPAALAYIARCTLEDWTRLSARALIPLNGWQRCLISDGSVRLYHPKLLQVTTGAAKSHTDAEARRAADRDRKRLKDLPDQIVRAGGARRLADAPAFVLQLDQWLVENAEQGKNRTVQAVRRGLEALSALV